MIVNDQMPQKIAPTKLLQRKGTVSLSLSTPNRIDGTNRIQKDKDVTLSSDIPVTVKEGIES